MGIVVLISVCKFRVVEKYKPRSYEGKLNSPEGFDSDASSDVLLVNNAAPTIPQLQI
jgi:hypothetical protein